MSKQKSRPVKRGSTALAKRAPKKKAPALRPAKIPAAPAVPVKPTATEALVTQALNEDIILGEFGLVELKFTPEEEAVLNRPVPKEDIKILPTGAVYLPHMKYTRWLNEAFGRTGWTLRPASKPLLNENTVVIPYLLMVHGKPVAFALGEQEYFATNKSQSYGDALESTIASGLRRCCKRLGIGLELWDRSFGEAFKEQYGVKAWNEKHQRYEWRRKDDPPFFWEGQSRREQRRVTHEDEQQRQPPPRQEPVAHHGKATDPITDEQKKRLWTIARRRGRTDDEVKVYIGRLGYTRSSDIKRKDYETICTALEHPGPLMIDVNGRQPGEDD
jgi:hypothetical protein